MRWIEIATLYKIETTHQASINLAGFCWQMPETWRSPLQNREANFFFSIFHEPARSNCAEVPVNNCSLVKPPLIPSLILHSRNKCDSPANPSSATAAAATFNEVPTRHAIALSATRLQSESTSKISLVSQSVHKPKISSISPLFSVGFRWIITLVYKPLWVWEPWYLSRLSFSKGG